MHRPTDPSSNEPVGAVSWISARNSRVIGVGDEYQWGVLAHQGHHRTAVGGDRLELTVAWRERPSRQRCEVDRAPIVQLAVVADQARTDLRGPVTDDQDHRPSLGATNGDTRGFDHGEVDRLHQNEARELSGHRLNPDRPSACRLTWRHLVNRHRRRVLSAARTTVWASPRKCQEWRAKSTTRRPDIDSQEAFDALTAFVPRLAVELGRGPVPSWTSVEGSMLSADISGFTALSEKLAGKGKAGAEEITSLINTCFTALIDSAYRYGGEVIKFGGDALLILFRGANHERRAADAGLLMQRALHSSPAAKRANLTMTVGAAAGPFDVFLVGSGYRELLITGPRATEVIRLEGEAAKGDTLVDALIADHLPADMKLREEHGGWVITGSTGDEPSGPGSRDLRGADLQPYVPPAVVEQLSAFADLGGEHRLVTVGFAMVVGLADQLDRARPESAWPRRSARSSTTLSRRATRSVSRSCTPTSPPTASSSCCVPAHR